MSYATFAIMNPLRFRDESISIDNATIFPNPDNVSTCYPGFTGAVANNYAEPLLINENFIFQYETPNTTEDVTITLLDENKASIGTSYFTKTDVTPVGWTGEDVHNITLNYDTVRTCYVRIAITGGQTYISDKIRFYSSLKDHIKIRYSNFENDFGMVLFEDPTQYIFTTYVKAGWITNVKTKVDRNVYEDDRGHQVVTRSTPRRIYEVLFPHLTSVVAERLSLIFGCSETSVNGYRLVPTGEATSNQETPLSNHFNYSQDMEVYDWDYKYILQSGAGFPYVFPYALS